MKKELIAIIGAGGFGREIKCLIDDINKKNSTYELIGFFDDGLPVGTIVNKLPVLGSISDLQTINYPLNLALAIGNPAAKSKVIDNIINNDNLIFPTLIHPSVIMSTDDIVIGNGCIICAGNILTCNIQIHNFVTLNLMCSVGHDTVIEDFSSFMPSVNISGEVQINKNVYVGTGAKIINQIVIGQSTTVGAGAIVSKSLPEYCTAVGVPAKPIKFNNP